MRTLGILALVLPCVVAAPVTAQIAGAPRPPRVLLVTAHPDDDAAFAAAMYRLTHHLDGVVDLVLVTDGSGGFRYATLAEPIYNLELTNESVARHYLPAIRKRELMAGGAIVGIRDYFFLDQLDHGYTQNADTVLAAVWDSAFVRVRLTDVMIRGRYDYVIGLLPFPDNHAHHKSATILALHAARTLDAGARPVVLGGFPCELAAGTPLSFEGLPGHPITRVTGGSPLARFDRRQTFGHDGRLNYHIVVNWVIAEHKSQGTMQLLMNRADEECYWYFDVNGPERRAATSALFETLAHEGTAAR